MVLDSNRPILRSVSEAIRVWLLFRIVLVYRYLRQDFGCL
nr:MAG TPA: hypothetical protein [Caudoviricetes sp.]DAY04135.1 MAG TPA: hypothetical protein [Caudoviricetes sp.]